MNISGNINLQLWAQDMAEQKASGLTRKQWCESKNMTLTTYDYRCRKVRAALEEKIQENQERVTAIVPAEERPIENEPVFAKVNLHPPKTSASGVNIRLPHAEINIAPDTPTEHISLILEALAIAQ